VPAIGGRLWRRTREHVPQDVDHLLGLACDGLRRAIDLLEGVIVLGRVQGDQRLAQRRGVSGVERGVPLPVLVPEAHDDDVGPLDQRPRSEGSSRLTRAGIRRARHGRGRSRVERVAPPGRFARARSTHPRRPCDPTNQQPRPMRPAPSRKAAVRTWSVCGRCSIAVETIQFPQADISTTVEAKASGANTVAQRRCACAVPILP
jgi:hypothetical protein